jgi:hypothetical protein
MKKLIVLVSFLILSLNSFSQVDTTKVCIPTKTARLVAQDLIRYDGCKQEIKLLEEKVIKMDERDEQKDTIIDLLNTKDENNQYIIHQQELQIGQYEHLTDDLQKELKGQKVKSFLWKAGTFVGILTSSYLLIK